VTEDCGRYLHDVLESLDGELPSAEDGWDAVALEAVRQTKSPGALSAGLGHPVHKVTDPRTPVLIGSPRKRACAGRTCGCSRRSAGCMSRCSAEGCR